MENQNSERTLNSQPEAQKTIKAISNECLSCGHFKPLTTVVDEQFKVWHLTNSEREIAFMLIKGYSLREIANSRSTSESTVRLQALAIYSKAGLAGRHELAAHFIEQLLQPIPQLPAR